MGTHISFARTLKSNVQLLCISTTRRLRHAIVAPGAVSDFQCRGCCGPSQTKHSLTSWPPSPKHSQATHTPAAPSTCPDSAGCRMPLLLLLPTSLLPAGDCAPKKRTPLNVCAAGCSS